MALYTKKRDWVPYGIPQSKRAFTEPQEEILAELFRRIFHDNVEISNDTVKRIMIVSHMIWPNKYPDQPFSVSNHYLIEFKGRHSFTKKRIHIKRRLNEDQKEIQESYPNSNKIHQKADTSHIVNCDETITNI